LEADFSITICVGIILSLLSWRFGMRSIQNRSWKISKNMHVLPMSTTRPWSWPKKITKEKGAPDPWESATSAPLR
jgi:hypothetical protein